MTDYDNTKRLSGVPPGRCIHTPGKDEAMSKSTLTRRALVASTAAVPAAAALGLPALAAAEPDPIFTAIEAHRRRCDEYWTTHLADEEAEVPWDERHVADAALAAREESAIELLRTKPTSLAGAAALLEYMVEYEDRYDDQEIVGFPGSEELAINETARAPDWYVMRNVLALLNEVKAA
jgi:hypothetical protein